MTGSSGLKDLIACNTRISSIINDNLSYANSCISEYLGCHIFNMIGIKAQETILGSY